MPDRDMNGLQCQAELVLRAAEQHGYARAMHEAWSHLAMIACIVPGSTTKRALLAKIQCEADWCRIEAERSKQQERHAMQEVTPGAF